MKPPPQAIGLLENEPFAFAPVILIVPTPALQVENFIRVAAGAFSEPKEVVSRRENTILAETAQRTEPGADPRKCDVGLAEAGTAVEPPIAIRSTKLTVIINNAAGQLRLMLAAPPTPRLGLGKLQPPHDVTPVDLQPHG
jgi:hypothetical protein